jgi:hypothetical protein
MCVTMVLSDWLTFVLDILKHFPIGTYCIPVICPIVYNEPSCMSRIYHMTTRMQSHPTLRCRGRQTFATDRDPEGLADATDSPLWYSTSGAFCTESVLPVPSERRWSLPLFTRTVLSGMRAVSWRHRYRVPAIGALVAFCWLVLTLLSPFSNHTEPSLAMKSAINRPELTEQRLLLKLSNSRAPCQHISHGSDATIAMWSPEKGGASVVLWNPTIIDQAELQAVWIESTALCGGAGGTIHMSRQVKLAHRPRGSSSQSVVWIQD